MISPHTYYFSQITFDCLSSEELLETIGLGCLFCFGLWGFVPNVSVVFIVPFPRKGKACLVMCYTTLSFPTFSMCVDFLKQLLKLFFMCLRDFHSISPTGMLLMFNFYLEVFLHQIINLYCSVLTTVLLNSLLSKKETQGMYKKAQYYSDDSFLVVHHT